MLRRICGQSGTVAEFETIQNKVPVPVLVETVAEVVDVVTRLERTGRADIDHETDVLWLEAPLVSVIVADPELADPVPS
jgi:hypothetical protein